MEKTGHAPESHVAVYKGLLLKALFQKLHLEPDETSWASQTTL
jgi:hypothetical protein